MTSDAIGRLRHNRWLRILGVAMVMLMISMMDRTNIGFAVPGMEADLGMTPSAIGFATGSFFWGYFIFQVPLGRLATAWSAKRVLTILALGWAVVCASTGFIHHDFELVINRIALGIVEGGVLPVTLFLIRNWFSRPERARANAVFLMGTMLASAIGNPICGLAVAAFGWRMMFIVTAIPAVAWIAVWWWAIDDHPDQVTWLPESEKAALIAALAEERRVAGPTRGHWLTVIWHPAVLLLTLYNFMGLIAIQALFIWLPSVLKETGQSIGAVGFLSAVPYIVSAVLMVWLSRHSDRMQERKWHVVVPTVLSGIFLVGAGLLGFSGVGGTIGILLFLTLAVASWFARYAVFWAMPPELLPAAALGVGMGVINGAGNLGGVFGPYLFGYLRKAAGNFSLALIIAGAAMIGAGLLAATLRMSMPERQAGRIAAALGRRAGV